MLEKEKSIYQPKQTTTCMQHDHGSVEQPLVKVINRKILFNQNIRTFQAYQILFLSTYF